MGHRFVGLRDDGKKTFLCKKRDPKTAVQQVLWGDWLRTSATTTNGWYEVTWSPKADAEKLWIHEDDTVTTRPLEIIFVDVGQGDGAVLITPERGSKERIVVIDAGKGDNMARFLANRFKAYRGFDFEAAIITHPDEDHYYGFLDVFEDHKIGFRNIYHSGLVERPVSGKWPKLGGKVKRGNTEWLEKLAVTTTDINTIFGDTSKIGSFRFPKVMNAAVHNPRIANIAMLSTDHGTKEGAATYLPEFAPSDQRGYTIEVLGPVVEPSNSGKPRLRRIGSYGETKNGHSILLRMKYGGLTVFFGGDLNDKAEKFLIQHYGESSEFHAAGTFEYQDMIAKARERFGSDVMKVCHHGSDKVTDAFMDVVYPAAFVISSGDEEGHVHPRPDLLGRLGRRGRGASPVLLSTELQRSTREREDEKLVRRLRKTIKKIAKTSTDELIQTADDDIEKLARTNVSVYGSIYVKTDGKRLITAFKKETGAAKSKWFYYEYQVTSSGELILVRH